MAAQPAHSSNAFSMPGTLLAFNASLRRAATRPRSVVRAIVAMLVFFAVATPVSAALCAASMGAEPGPAAHVSMHDGHGMGAAHRDMAGHHDSDGNNCCGSQVTVDQTALLRYDAETLPVSPHLPALAGPVAVIQSAGWSRGSIRTGVEADPPLRESVLRRLPRLLL